MELGDDLGGMTYLIQSLISKKSLHQCLHNQTIGQGTRGYRVYGISQKFQSRISDISCSGSPSILAGGGGAWTQFGMELGVTGSSIETWKTGWTARMLSRSQRV